MRTYSFQGIEPRVHPSVYAFDDVVVIGDVEIGEDVSLWPGVTVRGDKGTVRIGRGSNIQDHAMLHSDPGAPLDIGRDVTVAHSAVLHGCSVGSGTVVGIGAMLLNGVSVGESCRVSAGAVLSAGPVYPPRSLIAGTPPSVLMTLSDSDVSVLDETAAEYRELAAQYRTGLRRVEAAGHEQPRTRAAV
ncbi:gamma carbonic anhydrase family protein [Streptomyces collinus]|uniref:Carbonic anhydrase/acetyltransferase-like protein (Isoleucine patch superfamily) n=2 Tax=Streptomyces TaxID=1883 RepID=A0AA89PTE9_STRCU|nr:MULTISPECIES: gamma carbonic anhydrase family protein [Streptomyces]MBB5809207.1 carbonic anhydrase/acetyltransferase-like protein (isoleucine patch superfamily) [Streptomyces collinus]MEC7052184.1 gamma carbonic anhydrase family protein [Streptomyces violaceochromogenes]WMX62575.1 gamma carbonic anhydrase family protein [Streptomyces collinus]GHC81396.1 gamma carbonic anhydrase family protein [Streptomyces violaceochromogenes]